MPPLISLEVSPLKFDVSTPDGDTVAGYDYVEARSVNDSNVIQFSTAEMTRREAGDARRESEDSDARLDNKGFLFRQLFENSPAAIVLLDTYDHVIDLNPAFTKIFQYTLGEIKNLPLTDFIVPKGHMREAIEVTLKTLRGEAILQTIQRKRRDGSLVSVELTAYPVTLPGNRIGIFAIFTDVSQKKHAEQQTLRCEQLDALGILAGGNAREFNAVLGVLMAGMKQMIHALPQSGPFVKTMQEMNEAIERGAGLVGRLLAFAGRTDIHPDAPDSGMLIDELFLMLQSIAPGAIPIRYGERRCESGSETRPTTM
ncbi:MAG TPA: PAS domain S-box protein [Bacteroidota bacterium]|nr:PAS domain S-box protein [Bacteroidota bacterium]